MDKQIIWYSSKDETTKKARVENKAVLVDFFNPGWIGCQQMDAVTYPEINVVEYISKNMVALRVPPDNTKLMSKFNITWTPTLLILDAHGTEHRRIVGFMLPEELIPALLLGIAQSHCALERFSEALTCLGELLAAYPASMAAPEALFYRGVCSYKNTHNPDFLKETYKELRAVYPQSEWTQRAAPYRLL